MFSSSPPPETAEPATPDPSQERRERLVRRLERLGDMGMELAEALHRQAMEQAAAGDTALSATVAAFDRVNRLLRRTFALEERIAEGILAAQRKAQAQRAEQAAQRQARISERKRTVHDAVTHVVYFEDRDKEATERLFDDIDNWVDAAEQALFADDRPIGALVAQACRDVGLPIDLGLWIDRKWATDEWNARPPGSPYTAYRLAAAANPAPGAPIWPERPIPGLPEVGQSEPRYSPYPWTKPDG